MLVDWPWVSVGPAWVDIAAFCVNVGLIGGADPEDVLQSREVSASADPEAVTAFLVGLAAYFVESGRQPDHPRLPTLRAFQRAQGDVVARLAGPPPRLSGLGGYVRRCYPLALRCA